MSKKASAIVLAIVAVIVLAIAFFAVYPVTISYGQDGYKQYHSPLSLIQTSSLYTDTVEGTYTLRLDKDVTSDSVVKQIGKRLDNIYGYYACPISVNGDTLTLTVPKTANSEKTSAETVLGNVTAVGKVEILNTVVSNNNNSSAKYSSSAVVVKDGHFKSVKARTYASGTNTYFIVEITLNDEGTKTASALSTGTAYYVALDESLSTYCYKASNSQIQLYAQSQAQSNLFVGYLNSGALGGTLSLDDTVTHTSIVGLIVACAFAAVVVIGWIVLLAKFKALGIAGIYSQLIVLVVFVIVVGLAGGQVFNTASLVGLLCGYALMFYFTYTQFAAIHGYASEKTFASACHRGYADTNKLNLIVHAVAVVLGAIMWLIPTLVTAPFGNIFLYLAVLSFIATFGLNRLFVKVVAPFIEGASK